MYAISWYYDHFISIRAGLPKNPLPTSCTTKRYYRKHVRCSLCCSACERGGHIDPRKTTTPRTPHTPRSSAAMTTEETVRADINRILSPFAKNHQEKNVVDQEKKTVENMERKSWL
jgi:hypothetical protein